MNDGWIKLHRSCLDHWLYTEYRPLTRREAWETILFTVNYEDGKLLIKGQVYECKRGQSLLSIQSWAEKFVWSVKQVRTFFTLLEKDEMIITEGLQYTTRLTVCKYDNYQGDVLAKGKPKASQRQTDGKPRATIKENKEEEEFKKEEEIYRCFAHLTISKSEFDKLIEEGNTKQSIDDTLDSIENYKKNKTYTSLYLTAKKWLKSEREKSLTQPSFKPQENKGHVPPSKYGPDFDPSKQRF